MESTYVLALSCCVHALTVSVDCIWSAVYAMRMCVHLVACIFGTSLIFCINIFGLA